MANCPLTLRITKGSKLTFAELDGNFISLANCISSLPQYDSFVTGGTYNISTNSVDFTGNFDFIPFSTDLSYLANMDITVTGGTYNPSTGTVTFYNNSGGTFQVSGFLTGYTNYYTTGVTLNNTTLEFDRTDLSNAYSVDLSSLIFTGNTSGDCISDLYVSNLYGCSPITVWDNLTLSGSVIDSQGGGYLDLRYGGDGKFYLGNDNGVYSDTFINGESGYLEISAYDPNGKVAIYTDGGNAGIELSNSNSLTNDLLVYTNTLSIMSTPNGYPGGQNLFEVLDDNVLLEGNGTVSLTAYPHSGAGLGVSADLLIISNTSGSTFTTNSLRETNSSLLSSQYSTILQGVKNSVGLGGYNLNVNSDNTAFVDNLNIKTIGSGTSVINLGLDVNGNVVTGSTGGSPFTGNTSGDCITDLYISNLYGCSPITIHDNLILESGVTITTSNGGGQIELDYALQPSNILISTDNGGGSESFINLQPTDLNLSSLNGDVRIQSSNSNSFRSGNLFSNRSQILMEPDFVKIGVVDPSAVFSNDYESVVVYNTLSSDQVTSNANKWPVTVSSKNSTILSGVRNSVILGGSDITASTNNTVYVDKLNIKTTGPGASVINLGLDVNGNVVSGNTGLSSGSCISDFYVSNIHSCSPLKINPLDEGNVYFGSTSAVTINTSNSGTTVQIKGHGTTSTGDTDDSNIAFRVGDSNNKPLFAIRNNGSMGVLPPTGFGGLFIHDDVSLEVNGKTIDSTTRAFRVQDGNTNPILQARNDRRVSIGSDVFDNSALTIYRPAGTTYGLTVDGNVGIGTTTPSEKLEVSGKIKTTNFQMTSGATNGYVLTSDASGNATWSLLSSSAPQTDVIYVDSVNGVDNNDTNRGNIEKPYATIEYALSAITNTGTITGDTTNGSTIITGVTNTTNIKVGQYINGTNIPYGSIVVTKTSNTITLSKSATGSASSTTITWYTPKLIKTSGNFNVFSNLFKDGFSYDFGNSNITFSTILLNVTSKFYTPFSLTSNGEIVGTGTTSQFLVNSANQDSLSDFRINMNRYYSRGTGYQIDINQYTFNTDFSCVDFNASFGLVCRIGFISDSPGRQIFKGYFYGLLGGFTVYKTSGVFGIEGVVECPSTVTAISTNVNRGYLNGSVIGKCQFINFAVNGNITGDVVCANTGINGSISTVANTTYIYNKSTIGWLLANGNVTLHGDAFDNGIEIRKLTGAGTIISSTQANVTIDMLQGVTINWSTGNLTVLNGGGYYANSSIIDVSGGEVNLYGRHFFINSPGLRTTSNGIVNIFGSILEAGVINCSGGRINNYGRIKSGVNVSSGHFYNSGHIISDAAITQTSGTVELDGGTLEMSTTGTTAYLVSKTSGTLLLRGQNRFKVLNGKGPLKCTANTSASKDIYNFSTITNCDGTTYGLLLPWDGSTFASNDLVGGTLYENTSY